MRQKLSTVFMPLLAITALLVYSPMQGPTPTKVHAETGLAVLLNIQGQVSIHRNGSTIPGTFGFQLNSGDEVETGPDSSAEILFENNSLISLGPGSKTGIGTRGKSAPAEKAALGDQSFQTVQNFIKLKDSEGTSSVARLRSGDKAAEIRAESPTATAVKGGQPTFRWQASEAVSDLKFTIYNEDGVHWAHEVSGVHEIAYPADAPALESGVSYSWMVETTDPLQFPPLRSATAYFEVLSDDQSKGLESALAAVDEQKVASESAYHTVRASIFYDHGLMDDAIAETREALVKDPENATLQSILAHLYAQVGLTDEAIQEYGRLLEKR